ncbi:hypothetical protein ACFR9U_03700 [Halorientalis brevis]|uniref:Uncharacterized protein n=1 Tax=Halorientalis brevis TaxID=1126241 RepID=A0ABD6C7Q3_9EURY|nr:hypothetical protein [Halorientalis brevis]
MGNDTTPLTPLLTLLEGFTPGDEADAAAMFPLSPVALLRGRSGGTASPEEGTKRAVRQLYAVLLGLSSDSPVDTWQQLLDTAVFDAPWFTIEKFTGVTATTYRVWFHTLAQMLVESYSLRIIHDELVVDGHKRTTDTGRWLWRLPQSDREQLLKRCTDVDDETVEQMQIARRHRDELLYDFGTWGEIDAGEGLAEARQHLQVLTALDARATDGSVFPFFPDGVDELASTTDDETAE